MHGRHSSLRLEMNGNKAFGCLWQTRMGQQPPAREQHAIATYIACWIDTVSVLCLFACRRVAKRGISFGQKLYQPVSCCKTFEAPCLSLKSDVKLENN